MVQAPLPGDIFKIQAAPVCKHVICNFHLWCMLSQPDILLGKFAFQPLLYMILGYKMDVIQLICTSIDSVGDEEIGIATVIKIGTQCSPTPVCLINTQINPVPA